MSIRQDKMWENAGKKKPRPRVFDDDYNPTNKSREQEERVADALGGVRQAASGALRSGAPLEYETSGVRRGRSYGHGDVKLDNFLLDAKRTRMGAIAVAVEWLRKISHEAAMKGKIPGLSLEWERLPDHVERDWVLIPASALRDLLERKKEEK